MKVLGQVEDFEAEEDEVVALIDKERDEVVEQMDKGKDVGMG